MTKTHVPFFATSVGTRWPGFQDRFPEVTARSRLKAEMHSVCSPNAAEFMGHYLTTLRRLHQGAEIVDAPRAYLTATQQAAEVEALAAYRIHQSCTHPQYCHCLECRQRLIEQASRN